MASIEPIMGDSAGSINAIQPDMHTEKLPISIDQIKTTIRLTKQNGHRGRAGKDKLSWGNLPVNILQ
jgi:hypothetical protein